MGVDGRWKMIKYVGDIYFLEEASNNKSSFWYNVYKPKDLCVFDETTYIGIVFNLDNFISLSEWGDSQINSLLDG